jgi:DNA-binding transcriptional ArsR family regulator
MGKRIHFSALDLTRTRFAFSSLFETVMGFKAILEPSHHGIHLPWICEAQEAIRGVDLEILKVLIRPSYLSLNWYIPDFLTPPPTTPLPDFSSELEVILASDHEIVRHEIARTWQDKPELPEAAKEFIAKPQENLEKLVKALSIFWQLTLEMHWSKLRTVLEADVYTKARNLALGGATALFENIDPLVKFENGVLHLEKSICSSIPTNVKLDGRGLLLMPSVFVFPKYMTILDPPWQPVLAYTPRGVANLWSNQPPPANQALEMLLGAGRSEVLLSLETPSSTLEIARRLQLSSSSVSEHLGVLRQTGLVEPHRRGRSVYYSLSRTGCALLDLFHVPSSPDLEFLPELEHV